MHQNDPMDDNQANRIDCDTDMMPNIRKKSNLIIRGTSLIFDEIKVAKEEENQIKSLDEIEEENGDASSR